MKCPRCEQDNPVADAQFCPRCGAPVSEAAPVAKPYGVLKDENERLRRSLTDALEQQDATGEILRVIARSPANLQSVLNTVAERSARLCGANDSMIFQIDGEALRPVVRWGLVPTVLNADTRIPISRAAVTGRALVDRDIVHVHDITTRFDEFSVSQRYMSQTGVRTVLAAPLLRGDMAIGAIQIRRLEVQPFTDKQIDLLRTFADQAVIAIENVRLFTELQEKNRALTAAHAQVTEALEQQTATSEILRVISSSPTDVRPVFDAIVRTGARLCEADYGFLARYDGTSMAIVAHSGATDEEIETILRVYPMAPAPDSLGGRAILERAVVHIPDVRSDPTYGPRVIQEAGWRTGLGVPLLREGAAIGLVGMWRRDVLPFSDRQIELLKTFADQAVIAIENVRLFKELEARNRELSEALDQQTATSEILRVISRSPTDVQPVFDAIAEAAMRLCGAHSSLVTTFDGELLHLVAQADISPEGREVVRDVYPRRASRGSASGRTVLTRAIVQIPDVTADPEYDVQVVPRVRDFRSILAVPMLRDGLPIGTINAHKAQPGPFTDKQVALLETFADQAVIAIENVRLFTELQEKNKALTAAHAQVTEALDRQTATSEILRVIGSSPTDAQPVFETIARSGVSVCAALGCVVFVVDGDMIRVAATHGVRPERLQRFREEYPAPLAAKIEGAQTIRERRVFHLADIQHNPNASPTDIENARLAGYQTRLMVPMVRGDRALGLIAVTREAPAPFSDQQVELLQTFADQAVIAIENVRLFTETKEALEQQTATAEILSVISSSPTDVQPVFDAVLDRALTLCEANHGSLYQLEDGALRHVAARGTFVVGFAVGGIIPLASVPGRVVLEKRTLHHADNMLELDWQAPEVQAGVQGTGIRTVVAVPLLREQTAIGAIVIRRLEVRPFSEKQIRLLQTFADQAVIAIENVRLFTELQTRTQELTRSVGQLTALGEVGRAVSSTLDLETVLSTIVARAIQLSGTDGGSVYEYDEATEEFSLRASRDLPEAYIEQVQDARPRRGEGAVGRLAQTREPVQIVDISDPAAYESRVRNTLLQIGLRALLAVPLLAEDRLVGALIVMRKRTGTFAAEEVTLLQTFATQSALAIQNARLFREIEVKSRQLEVASQHKSEFLANMSHELRTPLNAIIGFSEVLTDRMFGELNEKQEEYLKDIYASGTHLLSLINDILDLSKIEAGRMELELTDFDLPTAIENALMLVRERAGRRSIALHTNIDNQLGQIQADERKIRQVVLNLLSNAIKFTPEGGRIDVAAVPKDGCVEISVSDTGIGIAPEDQEKVFDEFRQVGTAAKKVEGTGLGLTLCRKFVELHGGRIWVKSQVGVGSTFTFTIPARCGE